MMLLLRPVLALHALTGAWLMGAWPGHGSQSTDWSGDEDDGYNETL